MIKVGVIGVGTMGKNHVRVYSELPDVELIGTADIDEKAIKSISEKYHTKAFVDYKELLKQDLDAVSISIPTSLHKKVAVDIANTGVDMLIEKPIANTIKNAKEIIESTKKTM